eukprot:GFUD01056471.1.p1 GENE.GFUD01056471.1~~GFUD01056471.1.p1  ORF type:complete len:117 (+),score=23.41 GFUD01056471.1:53-352(+)
MVKNQTLLNFRKEDMACEHQRKRQNLHKRVTWSKNMFESVSETEPNFSQHTCRIQSQGQTCRKQSHRQTFSHRNWSEQEYPESAEESQKWIFGSSKLKP